MPTPKSPEFTPIDLYTEKLYSTSIGFTFDSAQLGHNTNELSKTAKDGTILFPYDTNDGPYNYLHILNNEIIKIYPNISDINISSIGVQKYGSDFDKHQIRIMFKFAWMPISIDSTEAQALATLPDGVRNYDISRDNRPTHMRYLSNVMQWIQNLIIREIELRDNLWRLKKEIKSKK